MKNNPPRIKKPTVLVSKTNMNSTLPKAPDMTDLSLQCILSPTKNRKKESPNCPPGLVIFDNLTKEIEKRVLRNRYKAQTVEAALINDTNLALNYLAAIKDFIKSAQFFLLFYSANIGRFKGKIKFVAKRIHDLKFEKYKYTPHFAENGLLAPQLMLSQFAHILNVEAYCVFADTGTLWGELYDLAQMPNEKLLTVLPAKSKYLNGMIKKYEKYVEKNMRENFKSMLEDYFRLKKIK